MSDESTRLKITQELHEKEFVALREIVSETSKSVSKIATSVELLIAELRTSQKSMQRLWSEIEAVKAENQDTIRFKAQHGQTLMNLKSHAWKFVTGLITAGVIALISVFMHSDKIPPQ